MKFLLKLLVFIIGIFLVSHFIFDVTLDDLKEIIKLPGKSICDNPITYKIGSIDSRFNLSEEYFREKIEEATDTWESAYGKELFVYDSGSKLDINLIYDERQENLDEIENNETSILNEAASVEEQNKIYDQKVAELEKQVAELNEQIDYWNSKGGAPEAEFKYLTKMQEDLNSKIDELNSYANKLNQVVDDVNKNIGTFNNMVSKFNDVIVQKPEVGFYTLGEEKIDIFFYTDEENLVNILAHEMGHSLGLDHIEEEGAMMNPVVSENTEIKSGDIELVKTFCEENTVYNVTKKRIMYSIDSLISKVSVLLK